MKEKLKESIGRWYEYVSKDHHKDRDCHWEIGESTDYVYSGEEKPLGWFVRHNGYITEYEDFGESFDDVAQKTIDFIDSYINSSPPLS